MKAYMIADLNNPTSVKYTEIALESWSKQSLLDIEVIQCYTPDTISELEPLYNFQTLLQKMQKGKESTKSERSAQITHWQLIKKRAESESRFFVMEHGLDWANMGLFTSCYTFSRKCAIYMNDLLFNRGFPLNGGTYGCTERLVKTYLSNNKTDKPYTWMTHHPNTQCVSVGRTSKELYETYNFHGTNCDFTRASTQVISKSQGCTLQHDGMTKKSWLRNGGNDFKVIP